MDNAAQFIPAGGRHLCLMLFEHAQSGADYLGLIVETSAGQKALNQLLKVWRNHLAHAEQNGPTVENSCQEMAEVIPEKLSRAAFFADGKARQRI
jgi:hypothetical protein